ncbi:MAG: PqqD family protein [Lachnospiraceae bacterium]|nr:PqqD family protein [Lachnospiraceae bacterium]
MKKQNNTVSSNYLDYIPKHNESLKWEKDEDGRVTLFVENKGFFNKLAQLLAKKPKISQIHLDEMGDFIWPIIDGKKSIYDISLLVKEEFGDKAEPLYNRLVQYMRNLESYDFIMLIKE